MRVAKTEIDVVTAPSEAVGGAKLEPEQRPVLTTDHINTQSKSTGEALQKGELRPGLATTEIGVDAKHVVIQSAAEAADYLSAGNCGNCRFFDRRGGQEYLEKCKHGDADERKFFNRIREWYSSITVLELMGNSIFMDERDEERLRKVVGSELGELGLCKAHSGVQGKQIIVDPEGNCLDGDLPNLFEALSSDVEKQLAAARDLVLKTAADSKT